MMNWATFFSFSCESSPHGHVLVPPGAVLRQVCPLREHLRKVEVAQPPLEHSSTRQLIEALVVEVDITLALGGHNTPNKMYASMEMS